MATVRHLGLLPFCITPSAIAPNIDPEEVYYIAGVSPATLLRWYWRVKAWSVSASVTSSSPFTPGTVTYDQTFTSNNVKHGVSGFSAPADEKSLVCRRRTYFSETVGDVGVFSFELFDAAKSYDGLYYPYLNIAFDGGNGAAILTLSGGGSAGGTITIDGTNVPSFINPSTTAGSVIITPAEYWPYDPGDGGGPIYNSTTGAQLRGFPS
jgi:hypothetical protein